MPNLRYVPVVSNATTEDNCNPVTTLDRNEDFAKDTFRRIVTIEEIRSCKKFWPGVAKEMWRLEQMSWYDFSKEAHKITGFTRFNCYQKDWAYVDRGAWVYISSVMETFRMSLNTLLIPCDMGK